MPDLDPMAVAADAMARIKQGAFLTVRAGDDLNTMTIGWALIGFCWRKPVLMVAVRDSRHTFGIIERAVDYTVSIPSSDMHEQVMFCGTRSGREVDKFRECGLKPREGRQTLSPILGFNGIHFECRIVFKAPMQPQYLAADYEPIYPDKDYHTLYFGEIQACYETR